MRTYYRSPTFEDTYHVTHGQKSGNIFRNNLIQKFKIGFNLSTETTSLGIISLDSLRDFIPGRGRQAKTRGELHTPVMPFVDTIINRTETGFFSA